MAKLRKARLNRSSSEDYRFIKVNGEMTKVRVSAADSAFEAAMKVRNGKRKDLDKELLIHGVTS
ncbi:hypothetical protein KZO79_08355 [Chromohalobacter sp. TMW 2.2271]|uniref:hypothetical protein n=1 Tax=Chromohalobacter sp. TMW 2.2271 TaxID=2860330 RepID=UPI0021BE12EE|nr:hypothetical protein [Chromohalobacter sp. TMW 2.2271]MCT8514852.1 hypothetical protein [Chromohalobacter sp. TMW 2.2271]